MKFLQNLSIGVKILIPPAVLALALVVVSLLALYGLNFQRETLSEINDIALDRITLVDEFIALSEQVQSDVFYISVLRFMDLPEEEIRPIQERMERGVNDLNVIYGQILLEWSLDEEEQAIIGRMKEPLDAFRQQARQAVAAASDNPSFGVILVRATAIPFAEFRSALTEFLDYQQAKIVRAEAEAARRATTVSTIMLTLAVGITLIGMVVTVLISNRLIAQPIRAMTDLMGRLAAGDLSIEVGDLKRRDEIGGMAQAVEVFRRNALEKAQAEEALRESQRQLATLMNNLPGMAYRCSNKPGWPMDFVSKGCLALTGYTPAELTNTDSLVYGDLIHPQDQQMIWDSVQESVRAGKPFVIEYRLRDKEGGERWVWEQGQAVGEHNGGTTSLEGFISDITERKKAEEMLRQQTAELQALAQVSSALRSAGTVQEMLPIVLEEVVRVIGATFGCIFLVEPESGDLVSRASYPTGLYPLRVRHRLGEGITGHVAATGKIHITDDLKHDPLIHIVPEEADALGTVRALLSLPLRAEERVIGVMHISLPEGHLFSPGEIRLGQSIADIAANAIQRAMVVEGLEDEVAARTAEIRAEQEKTETILRSVGDAIIMSDVEMRLRYVNDAFTTLTGYTAQEVLGQPIGMLMRDAMPDQARQAMQLALAQDGSWRGETSGRRKDGRTYDAALVVAPVYDVEGHLEGYVSSHRDISRAKALERARSQFITNVSHELRTPVTTIQLYAHLLQNEAMSETARRYLQAIGVETASLIRLVEDLIVMTVLDSGQILDVWKPVPLPAVIESIVTLYEDEARKADVALEVALLPPGLPTVDGDRARLAQALGELVENGITFTLAGGRVAVAVETVAGEDGDWITITVQDTGPGISPEEQDLVFDRFFRGKLAESGHVSGTGLGLSIAQEIARAHGGRVTVESELGEGSTFTLWLRPSVPDSV